MNPKSILLVLLLGVMNGTTLLASRFSVGQYSTPNYLTIRLAIASVCFGIAIWFHNRNKKNWLPKSRRFWVGSIFVGFLSSISMNTIIMAMNYISSGLNSVLLAFGPALTFLMAHFFLKDEHLTIAKIVGLILALGGVVVIVVSGESGIPEIEQADKLGYLLSLTGISVSGFSAIYVRKYLADFDSVDVAAVRNFITLVISAILSVFIFGFDLSRVDAQGILALFYAAIVGTFAAHLLNVFINQKYGATTISMTTYIIPIVSNIGGVFLLGEEITPRTVLGMVLIILGVLVINGLFPKSGVFQSDINPPD